MDGYGTVGIQICSPWRPYLWFAVPVPVSDKICVVALLDEAEHVTSGQERQVVGASFDNGGKAATQRYCASGGEIDGGRRWEVSRATVLSHEWGGSDNPASGTHAGRRPSGGKEGRGRSGQTRRLPG
jgi:hypothetical protein